MNIYIYFIYRFLFFDGLPMSDCDKKYAPPATIASMPTQPRLKPLFLSPYAVVDAPNKPNINPADPAFIPITTEAAAAAR